NMSESQLYDYGIYRIRQQLSVVQGTTLPLPYGGKPRQIMVDLDPQSLLAYGISAQDVNAAINVQNLTLPSGSAKIGEREYTVSLNSSPEVIAASFLGQTLNLMTLGGLALAVGILVDDATVEIENIHRNVAMGKPLTRAILDGAQQIAAPAFVATLSISIVFVSVVFLEGAP